MTSSSTHSPCDVSVTLLTRNAGPLLERVLRAVRDQETARHVEMVAVDSGSTDATTEVLAGFGARVISIEPDAFDFGRARDQVFESSHGPIVVCLSQDAIPAHRRWLDNLIAPLDDPQVAAACGRSIPDVERGFPQFPWERNGWFYFTREMRKFAQRYGRGLSNANSAIRRSVWQRLRFGDHPVGEDFRFQTKLHGEGLRIAFPGDAPVLHHHNYTVVSLYRRCRNEGLGLRALGCAYTEADLLYDLIAPGKYRVWARELLRGGLHGGAPLLFPVLRPLAVYAGSRFARKFLR